MSGEEKGASTSLSSLAPVEYTLMSASRPRPMRPSVDAAATDDNDDAASVSPFVAITWYLDDGESLYAHDVHCLRVPRHLVTDEKRALFAKPTLLDHRLDEVRQLVTRTWSVYRVSVGVHRDAIHAAPKHACDCEYGGRCPSRRDWVWTCRGCDSDPDMVRLREKPERSAEETKVLEQKCRRHTRCFCRDNDENRVDSNRREPCVFCAYVPTQPSTELARGGGPQDSKSSGANAAAKKRARTDSPQKT